MVGTGDDNGAYVASLRRLARRLSVDDAVTLVACRVTDPELTAYYVAANAFVTASEHEGFCVPVVEAMAFSLPRRRTQPAQFPRWFNAPAFSCGPSILSPGRSRWVESSPMFLFAPPWSLAGKRRVQDFVEPHFTDRLARALEEVGLMA